MDKITALYIRLSTEDYKVESMSINNQKLTLHKFVDNLDELANNEVREFVDNGYSGTNFERPAVQEMLNMVREGKIGCIAVKDFSRFGRDSLDVGYFMEKVFPLYGVRFISVNDDFDSGKLHNDTGGLNVAFKYLISEFYSRDLSVKYKSAKYVKFKRGEYQSIICPYGYMKSKNGRLEPDPDAAENVRLIFDLALQGKNCTEIAKVLYRLGVCTPGEYKAQKGQGNYNISTTQKVWDRSVLLRMLRDERYIGTYIAGRYKLTDIDSHSRRTKDESKWIKIPGHHPAIVSKDVFLQVQSIFEPKQCIKKDVKNFPLRGKVFCGCCRHAMRRSGQKVFRFSCTHFKVDEFAACHGLKIAENELEKVLYDIILKQAQVIIGIDDIYAVDRLGELTLQISEYGRQLDEMQKQKRVLFEQLVMNELSEPEYREQKASLDMEIHRLQEVHSSLNSQLSKQMMDGQANNTNKKLAQKVIDTGRLSTDLVDTLIERVYVYPDRNIEIVWKVVGFGAGEKYSPKNF